VTSTIGASAVATLREFRLAAGLTQQEVAQRVGVSVSQVSRWEQPGGPKPQPGHRARLARLFKVPAGELEWDS
jgi:transcriptional regulator with XRE-family HTH domain